MHYQSLAQFINVLEKNNELIRIKAFVDPKLEITEIADRFVKIGGPALLFENTGTSFPLLINAFASEKRMCLALGVNHLDEIGSEIEKIFTEISTPKVTLADKVMMLPKLGKIASWMPKKIKGKGICQEIIDMQPDLNQLPVMHCWPADGGKFITLPIIHTIDPETQIRNVGMYRMQIFDKETTGMHWHKHKVSAAHFNKYKKLKMRMPVSVALGGDPAYMYCATAPLPPNVDEYILAGFIRKKKVELVKCITNDLYVPNDADIIIEGYVDPDEDFILEGPFGDHTGYYSLADYYPKFHVTCITYKKNAIYPSTIVGVPPQEDAWIGKATERIFLTPIKLTLLPEMLDMDLPIEGVFHNLTIVQIQKEYAGHGQKVMNAMWGAGQMMFNKILVIMDQNSDVNIHDYILAAKYLSKHCDPYQDIYLSSGPMDVLDHSCSKFSFGGKMCIDSTKKLEEEIYPEAQSVRISSIEIDKKKIQTELPEIILINTSLLEKEISIVCIAIKKTKVNHVQSLNSILFSRPGFDLVKFIIYVDDTVDANELDIITWNFANNIDPKRDVFLLPHNKFGISHAGIDGTRKTKKLDGFLRAWPNIIVMDEKTIELIDEKWDKLNIGPFISSPSLRYKNQVVNDGAVVIEKD